MEQCKGFRSPCLHLEKSPLPCSSAPSAFPSPLSPVQSMEQVLEHTQEPTGGLSPSTCGHCPEPAQESTHHTHTDTQSLYTRDIPRKKHLIHPLNNSDNSVLSPIYMVQTRYRCYENIANIQKYIHLQTKQTPYKLLTIAIR